MRTNSRLVNLEGRRTGAGIGAPGPRGKIPVRGEPGWEIIAELAPLPREGIIDKPDKGGFCAADHPCHLAAIQMVKMRGGLFGAVAKAEALVEALPSCPRCAATGRNTADHHACPRSGWHRRLRRCGAVTRGVRGLSEIGANS